MIATTIFCEFSFLRILSILLIEKLTKVKVTFVYTLYAGTSDPGGLGEGSDPLSTSKCVKGDP